MKNKLILMAISGIGLLFIPKTYGASISIGPDGNFINGVKYESKTEFMNTLANTKGVNMRDSQIILGGTSYSFAQVKGYIQNILSDGNKLSALTKEAESFEEDLNSSENRELLKLWKKYFEQNSNLRHPIIQTDLDTESHILNLQENMLALSKAAKSIENGRFNLPGDDLNSDLTSPETQEAVKQAVALYEQYSKSNDPNIQAQIAIRLKILELESNRLSENASKVENQSKLAPFQKSDTFTTDALSVSNDTITGVVDNRINDFKAVGVASGDFLPSFGVWIKSLYTKANQKTHGFAPGYKFDQTGIIAGFDTGDDIKIGAAYSFSKNNITGKDTKVKEDIVNHIGIIYGLAMMNNQFFTSGQGSFGGSTIKKLRPTGDFGNHIASGSTKGTLMSGKVEVGYDYKIGNFPVHMVPTVGIAHNTINVKGYKETGLGLNRSVGKRNTSRTFALLGVMTKYEAVIEDCALVPEIHANIDYTLAGKNTDTQITIIDALTPMITPAAKQARVKYTIGTSVKLIEHRYLNTEIGYDLSLAKKFMAHTGVISFRAEF